MLKTGIIDINNFSGGLNTRDADHKLGANEAQELKNLVLDADGSITKRNGSTKYNSSAIGSNPVHSLYKFYKSDGFAKLLAVHDSTLYGGTGNAFGSVGSLSTSSSCSFETWGDLCYICNGTVFKKYNDITFANVSGTPPIGKYVVFRKNRLYVAGVTSASNRLYFCDVGDPATWNISSNFIDIRSNDGDEITGILPLLDNLVIYKKNSIWMLSGDNNLNFFLTPVIHNVGCTSPKTLVSYGHLHYFLHRTGVHIFNGTRVEKISGKVDHETVNIPYSYLENAVGIVHKEKYWLSYTSVGEAQNKRIIVFDTRAGFGGWVLFTGINARCFALLNGGGDQGELYCGDSTNGYVWELDSGTSDGGNSIATKFKSKNFNMGHPILFKNAIYAHITGENSNASVDVSIIGDHGTNSSMLTFAMSGDGSSLFGTAIFETDLFSSEDINTFQSPTNPVRGRGLLVSLEENSSDPYTVSGIGFEYTVEASEYKLLT